MSVPQELLTGLTNARKDYEEAANDFSTAEIAYKSARDDLKDTLTYLRHLKAYHKQTLNKYVSAHKVLELAEADYLDAMNAYNQAVMGNEP